MAADGPNFIGGRFPERWVRLGKTWINSSFASAILEQADGTSEVRLASGESYTSPYTAEETILLFRDYNPADDDDAG